MLRIRMNSLLRMNFNPGYRCKHFISLHFRIFLIIF